MMIAQLENVEMLMPTIERATTYVCYNTIGTAAAILSTCVDR